MMTESRLQTRQVGPIAIATIDRPAKLNALDPPTIAALERWVATIETSPDVRVAILTGAGEKAFSAGGDIHAWAGLDALGFGRVWVREGHRVFDRLARLRQPLIVVLNGVALGGGLELAGCADIIIAERHARLGLPETGLGMVPGWSGTQRLVRRFGSRVVKKLVLTGQILSAAEALGSGLVDEVVDSGNGVQHALTLAMAIADRGPVAVQLAKSLINIAEGECRDAELEAIASMMLAQTDDLQEGVASFRAKRPPHFKDR